jgi:hypothetical protein
MFLAPGSINHPFDVRICLAFEILCATKHKAAESVHGRRTRNGTVCFHPQLQSSSLLPLALQPAVGFGQSNSIPPFFPICHQLSPSSHS